MARITRAQFLEQRSPRRGVANPQRMRMPVWEWLVEDGRDAFQANTEFGGPDPFEAGPGWCFDRMGCSRTALPDGRIVHIAGEHEDSYDPDFYIYNDVIVRSPDGRIEIFGYPEDVFPPTDFHSATWDERRGCIWIVGSLGYPEKRPQGVTPVFRLEPSSFAIEKLETRGDAPGWMWKHEATLSRDGATLVTRRGIIEDEAGDHFDLVDDWSLDLESGRWTRLTKRPFQQWAIGREDGGDLMLFDMSCVEFEQEHPEFAAKPAVDPDLVELGVELDSAKNLAAAGRTFDATVFGDIYVPRVPHERIEMDYTEDPDEEGKYADNTMFDDARLRIGEAIVRYRDTGAAVHIKIEGALDAATVRALCDDLVGKLTVLQGAPCGATLERQQP